MKNKPILIAVFVLTCGLLFGAPVALLAQAKGKSAKSKQSAPRTIYDFYLKLPARYFPFLKRVKDRADFVESNDERNNYLRFGANVLFAPAHAEMALLKRMNGDIYLVVSYLDENENDGQGVLRFLEYKRGRFTEAAAAPPIERAQVEEIFRRKTGRDPRENEKLIYEIAPADKFISVRLGEIEICKLEWDGNVYDYAAPVE